MQFLNDLILIKQRFSTLRCDHKPFQLCCLAHLALLLPKSFKLFGLPIFWSSGYLMQIVIVHWYLHIYCFFHTTDHILFCYCCRLEINISTFKCFSDMLNLFYFHPKWNSKKYLFVMNLLNLLFYTDSCYFFENQSDFSYFLRSGGPHNWMSKSVL